MPLTRDDDIARVLATTQSIAVLGASANTARPSFGVMQYLIDKGYRVFPVNPGLAGQHLLGREVFASLADVPGPVDMVDVFRQSQYLPGIVEEAIAKHVTTLWTQLGVVHGDAAGRAEECGLQVVMDRCPAIEGPRLERLGLMRAFGSRGSQRSYAARNSADR